MSVALHFFLLVLADALQFDGLGICRAVELLLGSFYLLSEGHDLHMKEFEVLYDLQFVVVNFIIRHSPC